MHERVVTLGIQHEESLIEKDVDRLPPGTFDHELCARLSQNRCRIVYELAGVGFDPQVDTPLRIGSRRPLGDNNSRPIRAFRRRCAGLQHA